MAESFLAWVAGLPGAAVYAVLVVLSAMENVFPPVPADVAVVLGAFLSRQGLVSAPLLGVLCWMGNTASSAAMYFYARAHGPRWLASGWPSRFVTARSIAALEDAYARHGVYGIFLSRFLPGIRAAVTPVAGVVGLSPARALVPSAGASAIWYAFLVAAGSLLGQSWPHARALLEGANRVLAVVAIVVLVGALSVWVWRRSRRGRAQEE